MNTLVKDEDKMLAPVFPTGRSMFGPDFLGRLVDTWNNTLPNNLMRRYLEEDGSTVLEYNLAGFKKEDIQIKMDSALGELIVRAESSDGKDKRAFSTVLTLSPYTSAEDLSTSYENGVLKVTVAPLEKRKEESLIDIPVK